jgi:host factor-I protein
MRIAETENPKRGPKYGAGICIERRAALLTAAGPLEGRAFGGTIAVCFRMPVRMNEQNQLLQNEFLNTLRKQRTPVSVFLVNGIRLAGLIQSFDQYSIRLHGTPPQLVLKRVVATVVPDTKASRASKPAASLGPRSAKPRAPRP